VIDERDRQTIVRRYSERFDQFGLDPRTLNPGSEERYRLQHEVHASAGPMDGKSVLDIGCGLANYYDFLHQRGHDVDYVGYDIVPQFIESNRRRYPQLRFELRDVSRDGVAHEADYAVMCQVFNNKYEHASNAEVVKETLRAVFPAVRICASVDMLSSYVNYQEPHLNYFSPEEMFAFGKSLTPFVKLRHDYLPFHFTLFLYRSASAG